MPYVHVGHSHVLCGDKLAHRGLLTHDSLSDLFAMDASLMAGNTSHVTAAKESTSKRCWTFMRALVQVAVSFVLRQACSRRTSC